jgi:hypothetical protein
MSYSVTAKLLEEVLPLDTAVSTATLSQTVQKVAERSERELGKEAISFIEGCPYEWGKLPHPPAPLTVGIDGGYVRGREGTDRKAGWFEVLVCKSLSAEPTVTKNKCFGFVSGYNTKPRRRLFELLNSQGMQNNHLSFRWGRYGAPNPI